jgi:hypothetical protein
MIVNLTKGRGISGAIAYCLGEGGKYDKNHELKDAREPGAGSRAEIIGGQNFGFQIDSPERLELARRIMEWAALPKNQGSTTQKVENDCLHLSLAWDKQHHPDRAEMERAATGVLKALGMERARAVFIAHNDTEHSHLHIVASRIDPDSGLAFRDTRDMTKAHAWSLRWERENDQISESRRGLHKAVDGIRQGDKVSALDYLTEKKATFTKRELTTLLGYAELPDAQREKLALDVLADQRVIGLKETADAKVTHYTTRDILAAERKVMQAAAQMEDRAKFGIPENSIAAVAKAKTMTAEQEAALRHITGREGFAVIVGEAGTGKSWVMDAGRELYEKAGYQVIGTSTTHAVVQDMRAEGFKNANTLASALLREEGRRPSWNSRTVIFLDEAAMVSTKNMGDLMAKANAAGAKLIAAGDDKQLSSIDSGGLFRPLADQREAAVLTEVFRTRDLDQARAYNLMHEGKFAEALGIFDSKDAINWTDTQKEALEGVAKKYGADVLADPGKTRFIFAYTNADVKELNTFARELAKHNGRLEGEDVTLQTADGKAAFAKGDRIQFTGNAPNNNARSAGLTNGSVGTVHAIEAKDERHIVTVDLDARKGEKPLRVSFAVGEDKAEGEFNTFRHGYAGTIYRGQGRTLDQTYVYHTQHWRAAAGYVALSRHRESVSLFVARETAATVGELAQQIGRDDRKRAASSFHAEIRDDQAAAVYSGDNPSGAGVALRRWKNQPHAVDRHRDDESGKAGIEPAAGHCPPVDSTAAIKAELHRWHLGRVLVHQFSQLARRIVAAPAETKRRRTDDTGSIGGRWQRVRPVKVPELGLAAAKHAQQEQQRAVMASKFGTADVVAAIRAEPPDEGGPASSHRSAVVEPIRPPALGNTGWGLILRRSA